MMAELNLVAVPLGRCRRARGESATSIGWCRRSGKAAAGARRLFVPVHVWKSYGYDEPSALRCGLPRLLRVSTIVIRISPLSRVLVKAKGKAERARALASGSHGSHGRADSPEITDMKTPQCPKSRTFIFF